MSDGNDPPSTPPPMNNAGPASPYNQPLQQPSPGGPALPAGMTPPPWPPPPGLAAMRAAMAMGAFKPGGRGMPMSPPPPPPGRGGLPPSPGGGALGAPGGFPPQGEGGGAPGPGAPGTGAPGAVAGSGPASMPAPALAPAQQRGIAVTESESSSSLSAATPPPATSADDGGEGAAAAAAAAASPREGVEVGGDSSAAKGREMTEEGKEEKGKKMEEDTKKEEVTHPTRLAEAAAALHDDSDGGGGGGVAAPAAAPTPGGSSKSNRIAPLAAADGGGVTTLRAAAATAAAAAWGAESLAPPHESLHVRYGGDGTFDIEEFDICWDESDFMQRQAHVLQVSCDDPVTAVASKLNLAEYIKRSQGVTDGIKGMIAVVGNSSLLERSIADLEKFIEKNKERKAQGEPELDAVDEMGFGCIADGLTPDEATSRLEMMFSRGLIRAAHNIHAMILTSACDRGPVRMVGNACKDRGYTVPLVGVAAMGAVTWPGDTRPGADKRAPLQADHSHLVLLECNDEETATVFQYQVAKHLVCKTAARAELPAVAVCVSGGEAAINEVLHCVRHGWPVVVVKGSGGAADAIAYVSDPGNRNVFVANPKLMEIAREGKIEIIDLENIDGNLTRAMLERLFNTMLVEGHMSSGEEHPHNVVMCWEQVLTYRGNAAALSRKENVISRLILFLNVLVTAMVSVKQFLTYVGKHTKETDVIFNYPVVVLPILISVIVGIHARFQYGLKAKVLRAAADMLVAEIYTYRTRTGEYSENPDKMMGEVMRKIVDEVATTPVAEISLSKDAAKKFRNSIKNKTFKVSDIDDGFSMLVPDSYITLRLKPVLNRFQDSTKRLSQINVLLMVISLSLGGCAVLLTTFNQSIFIAVTTSLVTTISSVSEKNRFQMKISARNTASGDLLTVNGWWESRTPIEQANPQKFTKLVERAEQVLKTHLQEVNSAASLLAAALKDAEDEVNYDGLFLDMQQNVVGGSIAFNKSWMDKYPRFFAEYNAWYAKANKLKFNTGVSDVIDLAKQIDPDDFFDKATLYAGPEYEVQDIMWDPDHFELRTSKVYDCLSGAEVNQIAANLDLAAFYQQQNGVRRDPQGLISVIGMSDKLDTFLMQAQLDEGGGLPDQMSPEEAIARLRMVFSRGIVAAAQAVDAVAISSGLDVGASGYVGIANADRGHAVPLIGVVCKNRCTWPGDERPGCDKRIPLQPNHTHFVMLPGQDERAAMDVRFRLAQHYTEGGSKPAIAFVVNGGKKALYEVLQCVRMGWPIIVIKGTGGVADRIRDALEEPAKFITDAALTEVIQEGMIEFVELSEVEGALTQAMIRRLFNAQLERLANQKSREQARQHALDAQLAKKKSFGARSFTRGGGGGGDRISGMSKTADKTTRRTLNDEEDGYNGSSTSHGGRKKEGYEMSVVPYAPSTPQLGSQKSGMLDAGASFLKSFKITTGNKKEDKGLASDLDAAVLVFAWERQTTFSTNFRSTKNAGLRLRNLLLLLGVLSTAVTCTNAFVWNLNSEDAEEGLKDVLSAFFILLVVLPVVFNILNAVEQQTRLMDRAAQLSLASDLVISEIFMYRAGIGDYSASVSVSKQTLTDKLKEFSEAAMAAGVKEMGLDVSAMEAARANDFRTSPADDSFSPLTPEMYIDLRLMALKEEFEAKASAAARNSSLVSIAVYLLGGVGTGLAMFQRAQIFVAVTTAISSALVDLQEKERFSDKLFVFNRSLLELQTTLTWWRSLSAIEKANPQKYARLVGSIEVTKYSELKSLAPAKANEDEDLLRLGANINVDQFKTDLMAHTTKHGNIVFRRQWMERHAPFFRLYDNWTHGQDMWEPEDIDKLHPPMVDLIAAKFLLSSIITKDPLRPGTHLVAKWINHRENEGGTRASWFAMGPEVPPPVGATEAEEAAKKHE